MTRSKTAKTPLAALAVPAVALFTMSLMGGCASVPVTAADCEQVDWATRGYKAGLDGQSQGVPSASSGCLDLGFSADITQYDLGWREGIDNFCTPRRVLEVGLRRDVDLRVCGVPDRDLVDLAAFASGHRAIKADYERAESRLGSARSTLRRSRGKIDKHSIRIAGWQEELKTAPEAARPEIRHAIEKFRDKIAKHERRIRDARRELRDARHDLAYVEPEYRRSRAEVQGALRALGG